MNQVVIKLLPDGSGRVRIHWFMRTEDGPIETLASITQTGMGPIKLGGAKGRIACSPSKTSVAPLVQGGQTTPCCCSDDPRVVTCPECRAVPEFAEMEKQLAEILETGQDVVKQTS